MDSAIDSIYFFNFTSDIGFYDSIRNYSEKQQKFIGLALSTSRIQVNSSPTEYMITEEGSTLIKRHVSAHLEVLLEIEKSEAKASREYLLIHYKDGMERYFQNHTAFRDIFKLAEQHKVPSDIPSKNTENPYIIQPENAHCTPSSNRMKVPQAYTPKSLDESPFGMKWFNFFTKVRPWLSLVMTALFWGSSSETILSMIDIERIGTGLFLLNLIYLVSHLCNAFLQMVLLSKAKKKTDDLFAFIHGILIYDILFATYSYAIGQFYQGTEVVVLLIVSAISITTGYFVWYRVNVRYFQKRMDSDPTRNRNAVACEESGKKTQTSKQVYWIVIVLSALVILLSATLIVKKITGPLQNDAPHDTGAEIAIPTPNVTQPFQPGYVDLGLTLSEFEVANIVSYDADEYCRHMAELKEIVAKGTYSDELKRERIIDSLNHNDYFEYGEKIILYRIIFKDDVTYNNDIVDYLNERDDISYEEMVFVLEELGFAVFEDGTVMWD